MVLGGFVVSTLTLTLTNPPSWELINILNDDSFLSTNLASSAPHSITNFSEASPPEKAQRFDWSALSPSSIFVGFRNQVAYPP